MAENAILDQEVRPLMSDRDNKDQSQQGSDLQEEVSAEELTRQLEEALAKVPAEQLQAAQEQAQDLLAGDMKWAELMNWSPEQLHEAAQSGYQQYEMGLYDNAEKIFKGLTVIDPQNYYYHQMLGATFHQQKKLPEAVVEYSIALDLDSNDLTSQTNRGEVYFELKLLDLAEKDFNHVISKEPDQNNQWVKKAHLMMQKINGIRLAQQSAQKNKASS